MDILVRPEGDQALGSTIKAVGYAAKHCFSHLKPFEFAE